MENTSNKENVSQNATNKDIMTSLFPNLIFKEDEYFNVLRIEKPNEVNIESVGTIDLDWWNSLYEN